MYAELEKDFPSTTYAEWKIAVEKELKGLSFQDLLVQSDDIEQLTFSKFSAFENVQNEKPLDFRILDRSSNDWEINQLIEVKDEKVANKEALHALQLGASSLTFILEKKAIQWNLLFANIELKYIQTVFHCQTEEHTLGIQDYFKTQVGSEPILAQDFQEEISGSNAVSIKSFHIQQAGANAIQEVAFALSAVNEVLAKGQVSTLILEMGIGSKYMIEIAKFRTLRWLLNGLKNQYEFKGQIRLIARTTFVNKSLKDPHTNLLRQTTEAMSAILGGMEELNVQPYDLHALGADRTLSQRMAINISHLLKEESYLQHVLDPLGGSFLLETITREMISKSWDLFLQIEKSGGIFSPSGKKLFTDEVKRTAELRVQRYLNKEDKFIGMNQYHNPEKVDLEWSELPSYFELNALVLEKQQS